MKVGMNKVRLLQVFLAFDALLLLLFVLVTVVSSQASPSPTDTPTQIPNSTPLPVDWSPASSATPMARSLVRLSKFRGRPTRP